MDRFKAPDREMPVIGRCAQCHDEIRWGDEVTVFAGGDIVEDRCERAYINARFVVARGVIGNDGDIE